LELKDFMPTEWKTPVQFEQNKNYISLLRKNKMIIKNWADKYTSLEVIVSWDLLIEPTPTAEMEQFFEYFERGPFRLCDKTEIHIRCVDPKIFPRHKTLYSYVHKLEYVPLSTKWIVTQDTQNLKIPFNNVGAICFTVSAQVISNTSNNGWFTVFLTDMLSIPAAEDVAIFLHLKANYNQKIQSKSTFQKFKEHVFKLYMEEEKRSTSTNKEDDIKMKSIAIEELHVIMVFNVIGSTKKFVVPVICEVRMGYDHIQQLMYSGIYKDYKPCGPTLSNNQ